MPLMDKDALINLAYLEASIRNVDLEMETIRHRVTVLGAERAAAITEQAAAYQAIGLDVSKHLVIARKGAHDAKTGAPLAFGQVFDRATGQEMQMEPPAAPVDTSDPPK